MTEPAAIATSSFGALSAHAKDQLYLTGQGYVFTSPCVVTQASSFAASILIAIKQGSFELSVAGHRDCFEAVALKPRVKRGLRAEGVQLFHIGISPNHAHYHRFRGIPRPGHIALPRDAFAGYGAAFDLAYAGELMVDEATQLLDDVIGTTLRYLPRARPTDSRIERALEMLRNNPNYPLTELASAVGLSYDRMSHLFAEAVGLPLRSYLLWQKIHVVASLLGSDLTLTEVALAAGFTDSAHLSNAWQKAYGISPSYFFHSGCVNVHSVCQHRSAARALRGKVPPCP
ncbi:MAG: helix-turn-helix domain-containing protein [Sulfurifustaceae bacterium]